MPWTIAQKKEYNKKYYLKNKAKHVSYNKRDIARDYGLFKRFESIKTRCRFPSSVSFKNYGGRGIKCLWSSYEEFKGDMYKSYLKHLRDFGNKDTTIERVDVNGHYCKDNCKWATWKEQSLNKRK